LLPVLERLSPPKTRFDEQQGKEVPRRAMLPPLVLTLLSILSRYLGLSSQPDIQAAVLADVRWMSMMGFNAREVEEGACQRSAGLRGKTREGEGGRFLEADEAGPVRTREEGPRGALSAQTVAGFESALEGGELERAFNEVVRALVRQGLIGPAVRAALDSTGEEVVPTFEGAGVVRKKVKVESKARRPRQVEVSVRGFKLWYVMDVESGLPLAMRQDTIEKSEGEHARAVVDQAWENLGGNSRLVSLCLDRGFLDGDLLWWLKNDRSIDWVCPAKEKMGVTAEARRRVMETLAALSQEHESPLETAQRAARRGLSHEGVSFAEREKGGGRPSLVVARVDELLGTEFYGPGGASSSRVNSKQFRPTPLFATVVLRWADRSTTDREDEREHDEESRGPLVLLSPVAEGALVRFDRYDERSLIENRLHREGKQHFGLGCSLVRTPVALWSATVFSTIALMLHRGLALHRERMEGELERRGERLGVLRYRREMMLKNRERVIVVVDERYGVLTLSEFAELLGAQLG
jgi:hypothetical protein